MIILGIDPGLAACGFALIEWPKASTTQSPRLLVSGTVKTEPGGKMQDRAEEIDRHIGAALKGFGNPDRVAIEYPGALFGGQAYKGVLENFYVCGYLCGTFKATHTPNPSDWTKSFVGKMKERMADAADHAQRALCPNKRTSQHEREAMAIALWCAVQ